MSLSPSKAEALTPQSGPPDEAQRLREFAGALDAIRDRVEADLGQKDLDHARRIDGFSRAMELTGRALIHFSLEPVGFSAGIFALAVHKVLQASEIGHAALHGAYDGMAGAERYASKTFAWDSPIDEESWRQGHNVRHHQYTNIAGKDPDIHFGNVRLSEYTPQPSSSPLKVPMTLGVVFPNFMFVMNAHFTGLIDLYFGNGRPEEFDFVKDRSWATVVEAHKKALRKYIPYYAKNYLFFPLLAGPFFGKVLFGNWMSEMIRDIYLAATIYCGHVGEDVVHYPEGTRAHGRGEWYKMQVEASNNFDVSWPISILCGALDRQIEHHLFPKLPPNRLREISSDVQAACRAHGVDYKTDSWPRTLKKAFRRVTSLSRGDRGLMVAA